MTTNYSNLVRQSAHGSLALLIGQVLSTLILAISTIIVAGTIGSVQYGEYAKVLVPVSIAVLLQDPGITVALTRYVSMYNQLGDNSNENSMIVSGLIFNIMTSIIFSSALYIFSTPIAEVFMHQSELGNTLKIASFTVIGLALFNLTKAILIGYMRVKLANLNMILHSVLQGVVSSSLVLLGFGLDGAVIGHMVAYLIAGTIALIIVIIYVKKRGGKASLSISSLRELLSFGIPVYLSNLISGGLTQLTSSLMVIYVNNSEIGNFSAAITFSVLVSFLITPIQTTLYPLFSKLEQGSSYLNHAYKNAVKYSALVAIPGALALMALADPLITTIYGDKYPSASLYFAVYLLTYMTIGLSGTCQASLLNSQGKTEINMWRNMLSLITGASLAFILMPRFGVIGLIASLIISAYPALIYGYFYIKSKLSLSIDLASSGKIYFSSISALAVTVFILNLIYFVPFIELVLGAFSYLVTYVILIKITRTLNEEDYMMFRSILGSTGPLSKPLLMLLNIIEKL